MSFPRWSARTLRRQDVQAQLFEGGKHLRTRIAFDGCCGVAFQLAVAVKYRHAMLIHQRTGLIHAVERSQCRLQQEGSAGVVQVELTMQALPPRLGGG